MRAARAPFHSSLAHEFARFAKQMQTTGGTHTSLMATIGRLDAFLAKAYPNVTTLSYDVLSEWFASFDHLRTTSQSRYRTATFQVCKFLRGSNALTAIREDFQPFQVSRDFQPYIFSNQDIVRLLQAARACSARPSNPLRPETIELVVILLYTAGLRVGEVVRLNIADYDSSQGTLVIRETKFAKSRLVPVSPSAKAATDKYLSRRRQLHLECAPENSLLWYPGRIRLHLGTLEQTLCHLLRQCGFKPLHGRLGARNHDLRHAFAHHRVLQWYREGADIQRLLPYLSTYMGHRGLESTQLYLKVIPEVLNEASALFGTLVKPVLGDRRQHDEAI